MTTMRHSVPPLWDIEDHNNETLYHSIPLLWDIEGHNNETLSRTVWGCQARFVTEGKNHYYCGQSRVRECGGLAMAALPMPRDFNRPDSPLLRCVRPTIMGYRG
eukprot:TRINITY_DN127673_c0_g1_i2.p1 TRINITY_DN127673_c0_g1~~TRINITY_DN127673_c0_g1_i2.p1  ORF type:complete len:104 (+),score=4.62 TRINITY_DN127673_c0_g1_i2:150-461(+)